MGETRIFLSPLLAEGGGTDGFSFTNKIDWQLLECTKILRVRLLSVYSPIDMPSARLYITGLRRQIFGQGLEDDFFPLVSIQGDKVSGSKSILRVVLPAGAGPQSDLNQT